MNTRSDETQSNLNATTEPSDSEANVVLVGELEPTFLDDEGPSLDVPLFITRTNARELFGLRPGETVAEAAARTAAEATQSTEAS
ncbi:pirin [Cupriavidus campinensis]